MTDRQEPPRRGRTPGQVRPPNPGNVMLVLNAVQKAFPNFAQDHEMRTGALIGLAQVVGMVAAWTHNKQGPEATEKALQMVYAMAFATAQRGDALLREKDAERDMVDRLLGPGPLGDNRGG